MVWYGTPIEHKCALVLLSRNLKTLAREFRLKFPSTQPNDDGSWWRWLCGDITTCIQFSVLYPNHCFQRWCSASSSSSSSSEWLLLGCAAAGAVLQLCRENTQKVMRYVVCGKLWAIFLSLKLVSHRARRCSDVYVLYASTNIFDRASHIVLCRQGC